MGGKDLFNLERMGPGEQFAFFVLKKSDTVLVYLASLTIL